MSQYGCYTFDRLFCECGMCPACKHRALMEEDERKKTHQESVGKAVKGFFKRVNSGAYKSPEQKREKAKQRALDEKHDEFWRHPDLFPREST